jgi:hypothetical protein
MSEITNGTTDFQFAGTISCNIKPAGGSSAAITGLIIGASLTRSFGLAKFEANMAGVDVLSRRDNRKIEGTITIRLNSSSPTFQDIGAIVDPAFTDTTFAVNYFLESIAYSVTRGEYSDYTYNVWNREGITLSMS